MVVYQAYDSTYHRPQYPPVSQRNSEVGTVESWDVYHMAKLPMYSMSLPLTISGYFGYEMKEHVTHAFEGKETNH